MTPFENGHAVNVGLASTSVTSICGLPFLTKRAADAPAKPPLITTTFGPAPCAIAGIGIRAAALAAFRNWRRFALIARLSLLLLVPRGDRPGPFLRDGPGDAIHD